jgi:hypothetical protein
MHPRFFVYNGLPIYLVVLGGEAAARATGERAWADQPARLSLVARALSAAFSTLAAVLGGLLGDRLVGRGAGLLAAAALSLPFRRKA